MTVLRLDTLRQHQDVLRLRTGETLAVRFVEPRDADALQDYFRALSVRSRYNRFLGAMSELSATELDHFIHVGERDRFSVIAVMTIEGIETIVGQFPFAASGRALSMNAGSDEGFVRVIARADNRRILGVQAVGAHISEMSGEFVHAIEMGAVIEDIAGTIHAHPTLGEAFGEAALRSIGLAIHI